MQTLDSDGPLQPTLLYQADNLLGAVIMNTKARLKSLEQGTPWIVDGATGRVLPWSRGGKVQSIEQKTNYLAVQLIDVATETVANEPKVKNTDPKSDNPAASETMIRPDAGYLYELESLVLKRKRDLPEGSYTTHLFTAGLAKIRKKAGEEAIELLLAQSADEVCNEASDLLYHLTVLFAALDIPWAKVLDTLRKR